MLLTLMLTSKGVAGVPRASLVILAGTLASYGLPLEGVTLILGVDELMDMAPDDDRTSSATVSRRCVVAKWEGEFVEASDAGARGRGGPGRNLSHAMAYGLSGSTRSALRTGSSKAPRARGAEHAEHAHQAAWWKVMCLTGVDYFSTLGYQPGIAFLAAGPALADRDARARPAHAVRRAADVPAAWPSCSPHGQGSISILEELLPRWRGKALVLCLLGFRRHRLHHHHHAVGGGRDRAPHREPVRADVGQASGR